MPDNNPVAAALFSRNRRAVLGLLFGHPDEAFYLRQIIRAVGGFGAVQRELQQLTDAAILRRSVRGNQVYFQANSDCPVFQELKAIIMKTTGMADVLRTALAPLADRITIALIFGSIARGEGNAASDVDLLVVGRATFREVVGALASGQERLQREINPTVYSLDEFRGKLKVKHHFVRDVLLGAKVFLIGGQHELDRLAED